ncbi:MAG: hypothetical protein ACJARK_002026 [Marinobacter psychrophilus]|jgi:hypothetical protein|nr:hypothetical protein MRBBS_1102 [Marinobacter sp. BSs20148]
MFYGNERQAQKKAAMALPVTAFLHAWCLLRFAGFNAEQ